MKNITIFQYFCPSIYFFSPIKRILPHLISDFSIEFSYPVKLLFNMPILLACTANEWVESPLDIGWRLTELIPDGLIRAGAMLANLGTLTRCTRWSPVWRLVDYTIRGDRPALLLSGVDIRLRSFMCVFTGTESGMLLVITLFSSSIFWLSRTAGIVSAELAFMSYFTFMLGTESTNLCSELWPTYCVDPALWSWIVSSWPAFPGDASGLLLSCVTCVFRSVEYMFVWF